jgi:hypothetical protein
MHWKSPLWVSVFAIPGISLVYDIPLYDLVEVLCYKEDKLKRYIHSAKTSSPDLSHS